jgi:hypothetical protein
LNDSLSPNQGRPSRVATQQSGPVAIAEANAATAEGLTRAVIELVVEPAVVRAISAAAECVGGAMVAEPWRQRLRTLPIHVDERSPRKLIKRLRRRTDESRRNPSEQGESKCFHGIPSEEAAIEGASTVTRGSTPIGRNSSIGDARFIGRRTMKREPLPSLLSTSMPPLCKSTAILTR